MPRFLRSLARACARRPLPVLVAWVAVALAVHLLAAGVSPKNGDDVTIDGTDSARASELVAGAFPGDASASSQLVLHSSGGRLTDERETVEEVISALRRAPGVADATEPLARSSGSVSEDGRTALVSVSLEKPPNELTKAEAQEILDAARAASGQDVEVEAGGPLGTKLSQSSVRSSELIGLAAAVVVLLLAFGTVPAMVVPILTAIVGLSIALGLITLAGSITSIPQVAPTLATMIGLGVGIDYALFLVTRVRAQRRAGEPTAEAIGSAMAASGGAVVFAGATVVVALCALVVADLSLISKLGWSSAIAVVVAVLAAVTLLPASLGVLGDRIESLSVRRRRAATLGESPAWRRWAEGVARRPWRSLLVALVLLVALAAPAATLTLGQESHGDKPASTTVRKAYDLIAAGFGPGHTGPLLVAMDVDGREDPRLTELERALAETPGVADVTPARVSEDGRVASMQVSPAAAPSDEGTQELVHTLREDTIPGTGATAYVGGATAAQIDLAERIAAKLPLIIATVVGLSLVLLLLAFRSIVLPLKAAAMNLVSVAAAYGLLTAVFQHGWGAELIGLDGPVPVVSYVPMMMFAILFGLSMDYEVFLLSRVQEHHHAGASNRASVIAGLASTGRIITAAALIMISVFASFLLVDDPTIKMFGLGLAAAIAIDATIVRCLLVPAAMVLMDSANWWLPGWLGRRLPTITIEPRADAPARRLAEEVEA